MKVLHCPEIVGGNAQQLARAERELGIESIAIAFRQNYFNYEADEILLPNNASGIRMEIARWKMFWRALSFDVIHYNFGQSIMRPAVHFKDQSLSRHSLIIRLLIHVYSHSVELLDVRALKSLGKGIVVTFQGDDARQGDYCRKNFVITFADEVDENYYSPISDEMKRKRIAKFSRLADRVYALNPDLLYVLPSAASFLPYSNIDLRDWPVVNNSGNKFKMPVVLHAPSHKGAKGTRFILEAVERLKKEGIPFEFVLIEGMSISEAKKQYKRTDLLIDQLLAGWYGGLAVELMALGKPVICYIRKEDLKFIPAEMEQDMPIVNATPATIYEVLRYWLTEGKSGLHERGIRSRHYVEKWHDPLKIAAQTKREYERILEGCLAKTPR